MVHSGLRLWRLGKNGSEYGVDAQKDSLVIVPVTDSTSYYRKDNIMKGKSTDPPSLPGPKSEKGLFLSSNVPRSMLTSFSTSSGRPSAPFGHMWGLSNLEIFQKRYKQRNWIVVICKTRFFPNHNYLHQTHTLQLPQTCLPNPHYCPPWVKRLRKRSVTELDVIFKRQINIYYLDAATLCH